MTIRVSIETGTKRVFASALDWPGWSRGAKTEADALASLVAYGPRYAKVARRAKVGRLAARPDVEALDVVERLKGGSGTDFGVPGTSGPDDEVPLDGPGLARLSALLRAAWATFDEAASAAVGIELTRGPRGGGRELAKIVEHVLEAERAYVHQIGGRHRIDADADPGDELARVRDRAIAVLTAKAHGEPVEDASQVRRPWTLRYFARRSAWHTLDHAWEIEDRALR